VERKRLVIDANILIRAYLGVRVRALIAEYVGRIDFFCCGVQRQRGHCLYLGSRQAEKA